MAEMTEAQRKALAAARARAAEQQAKVEAAPRAPYLAAAQGLTLGTADEIEAGFRSLFGGRPYEDVLNEVRGTLKAYQEARPIEALAAEAGGAVVPAVGAALLAPFTGGASTAAVAPTLGRLAGMAALEGGAYAFNTGEGGFQERAARIPGGALTGAVGGAAAGTVMRGAGGAINALTDAARRIIGNRGSSVVENEIQRLAQQTGKSADEIAADILDGRILAENETIRAAVRAYRAGGGEASTIITQALTPRPAVTRAQAMDEMRKYLSDIAQPSALQAQRRSEEAVSAARTEAYAPFKTITAPDAVSREVLGALEVVPDAIEEVNKMFRGLVAVTPSASGVGPANVTFTRAITLDEAERVRRAIANAVTAEYRASRGGSAEVFKDIEKSLRGRLDVASPELGAVRAQVAKIEGQNRAFEAGQAALVGDVNETLFNFSKITDPERIDAYRAGLMAALEARAATGSRQSMIRNLANPETKEGQILRAVLPQDALDDVLRRLEIAKEADETAKGVLFGRQSVTSDTMAEQARIGMGINASDVFGVLSGSPEAMINVASNIAARFTRDLTDAERARVARILVSEDPDLVRRAISDESAMAALQQRVQQLTAGATRGARSAGAVTAAEPGANLSQQTIRGLLAQ